MKPKIQIKTADNISDVTFRSNNPEWTRIYKCEYYSCNAHPRSCFFCKHCSDVFFNFLGGPYNWVCQYDGKDRKDIPKDGGMNGKCKFFEEDEKNETD